MNGFAAIIAAPLLLSTPQAVVDCTCPAPPPCQKYWMADAVFTGLVIDVTSRYEDKQHRTYTTIVVERSFRGGSGLVVLRADEYSCKPPFIVGQRYLVYASRRGDGWLSSGQCAGNKLLSEANADLDFAEHLPPPGSGGRIYGGVTRAERYGTYTPYDPTRNDQLPGVTVTVRDSVGVVTDLPLDRDGHFEAVGLKEGTYAVTVAAPSSMKVRVYPPTIALEDRSCVPVGVSVEVDGRITGRIVDSSGNPVKGVRVAVLPAWFIDKVQHSRVSAVTDTADAAGRYDIGLLPADEYVVGVNIDRPPTFELPYPPTYFPGVFSRDEAKTISIGEGATGRAVFALPLRLTPVSVSGTVMFDDGTPAAGVGVSILAENQTMSSTRTDSAGAFVLKALSGSSLLVRATLPASGCVAASAETSISTTSESVSGVTMVLQARTLGQPRGPD